MKVEWLRDNQELILTAENEEEKHILEALDGIGILKADIETQGALTLSEYIPDVDDYDNSEAGTFAFPLGICVGILLGAMAVAFAACLIAR